MEYGCVESNSGRIGDSSGSADFFRGGVRGVRCVERRGVESEVRRRGWMAVSSSASRAREALTSRLSHWGRRESGTNQETGRVVHT